jgi:hypothetical protein
MAAFASALAAVPVIEKIISAIWPAGDKSKKTKQEASNVPAVSALAQASSDALKSASDQLALVSTVIDSCFVAEDDIVRMQAVLEATADGALTEDDKLALQKWWDEAKKKIDRISDKDTLKSVKALDDVFTRTTFLKVINANTDAVDQDLKKWSIKPLWKDLAKVSDALDDVNTVAVQVIAGLGNGLAKLAAAQTKK